MQFDFSNNNTKWIYGLGLYANEQFFKRHCYCFNETQLVCLLCFSNFSEELIWLLEEYQEEQRDNLNEKCHFLQSNKNEMYTSSNS